MPAAALLIPGPEPDLVELLPPHLPSHLDLTLNLGLPPPPPRSRHGLALELALGRDLPAHSLRQNWPRFEPSMSGSFLSFHAEIDPVVVQAAIAPLPASSGMNSRSGNPRSVNPDRPPPQQSEPGRSQLFDQEASLQASSDGPQPDVDRAAALGLAAGPSEQPPSGQFQARHRFRRCPRISRRPSQAPHIFEPIDAAQPSLQIVAPSGSSTALHFLSPVHSRPSLVIFRSMERRRNQEGSRACPDLSYKEFMPDSNLHCSKEEESGQPADFECNICLDMAKEPVVTCCGHLFCWPCLYQWLHVHSHKRECPVCKGVVVDNAITPIYGRGSAKDVENCSEGQRSGNIPPRPNACRLDSSRQWQERGASEEMRVEGETGDVGRDGRAEGSRETGRMPGNLGSNVGRAAEQIMQRLRLQREHFEERLRLRQRLLGGRRGGPVGTSLESRTGRTGHVSVEEVQDVVRQRGVLLHEREQILTQMAIHRLQRVDRLAAIRARLASMDGLLEDLSAAHTRGFTPIHTDASRLVINEEVTAGQRVQEVTELFVVEENMLHRNMDAVEQGNAAGSNAQPEQGMTELLPTPRRRRHGAIGGASGSADAEPGLLHARKRRRLN